MTSLLLSPVVCNPTCDWPEPRPRERDLVLAVGKEKHRQEILEALRPTVLDYDSKSPARRTDEMGPYYDRAAVVHPTYLSESYCRVAVEAMWHGCALVYTALGNLPELIGNTAGIALAHDATAEAWAAAVGRAKEEPWRGEAGRRRAEVIRTYHAAKPALMKVVRRVSRGRKPWEIWLAVPDYPGVATGASHLAEIHGLHTSLGRLPER
ncbi:MAG: glycosyltransferase [Pirellulales bacterium]|nr:glycosyltransferase [Pirellulales bacterium]